MAAVRTIAIIGLFCLALAATAAERLPRMHALTDAWTVSGLSSGGYLATQIAVAYSSEVRGVGVFAGGPYYCVGIDMRRAEGECMKGRPDAASSRREAERLAALRLIDPVENLKRTRAWVMAGALDNVVAQPVVQATAELFAAFNAPDTVFTLQPGLGHGLPTVDHGVECTASASPFLNRCGVPGVARMLDHLLPSATSQTAGTGRLTAFDQAEFVPLLTRVWNRSSLDPAGFVFVPERCDRIRCRVHVALHGCRQGNAFVGEAFARQAGYNGWAAEHDLIVVYPQVRPVEPSFLAWWRPYNPRGCWDWWGYTGSDYATRGAVQMEAIRAMVQRLGEPR